MKEMKPFTFRGYPNVPVYIHEPCGTVYSTNEEDALRDMAEGLCDCETPGKWLLIYVEDGSDD